MKSTFAEIYAAALKSDTALTADQKSDILRILRGEQDQHDGIDAVLYTQRQTCKALGVSRFTVFRMVRDGQLHPVQIRGARRYRRDEILAVAEKGVAV